jgi:hypothetical protein
MEAHLLTFAGVGGYDVYNCSIPFEAGGRTFLFGRVERREVWAHSTARLFERTGTDAYRLVKDAMVYPLEDPFVSRIHGELVLGGTHVRLSQGKVDTYHAYFYRGTDPADLTYFTSGPEQMKDIRLIELADGHIGVFSRPRGPEIAKKYKSEAIVGFTTIRTLDELNAAVVQAAPRVENLFGPGEWGGCNQCYLLRDGMIGIIGHKSYLDRQGDVEMKVYTNITFVLDPAHLYAREERMLGTAKRYPPFTPKVPDLADCAFTSGIVMRPDGRADLYSGVGDTCEGRLVIDDPFAAHGGIAG